MKAALLIVIVLLTVALVRWILAGSDVSFGRALPFMNGRFDPLYDLGALAMLVIFLWGLVRLGGGNGSNR